MAKVHGGQVDARDAHSSVDQAIHQPVDHDLGATVHGDIGHQGVILGRLRDPVLVRVQDELWPAIHRAVAGRDHINAQGFDLLAVAGQARAKRHHDLGVVALGGRVRLRLVVGEKVAPGAVGAEKVASEQNLVLAQMGEHGFRPVHPGREDELQRASAQIQRVAIADQGDGLSRQVHVQLEQIGALLVGDHFGLGKARQHRWQAAGMVLLGVLRDHVVELAHARGGQIRQQLVTERAIHSVEQSHLVVAFDHIGVVTGAVRQGNEIIEERPVPVEDAHRMNARLQASRCHNSCSCSR